MENSTDSDNTSVESSDQISLPRKEVLDGRILCEISVPQENGLFWSVFLCFFMNMVSCYEKKKTPSRKARFEKEFQLDERMRIVQLINSHNVFVDHRACFTEELETEMKKFKRMVRATEECDVVKSASNFFDAKVSFVNDIDDFPNDFRPDYRVSSDHCFCDLVIFKKEDIRTGKISFSFGIDEALVKESQATAIRKALDEANKFNKIPLLISDIPELALDLDLAVSLLKHKCFDFLLELYKQPPYVFDKLSKALVLTSPTEEAFFQAILSERFDVLYSLYNYAVNEPQWWTIAGRELTPQLEKVSEDLQKIKNHVEVACKQYLTSIEELLRINKFQRTLISACNEKQTVSIFNCMKRIIKGRKQDASKVELMKRKVINLLDVYIGHFDSNEEDLRSFPNYYFHTDTLSALYFFDNIFTLKSALKLPNGVYEKIESAFCSMLFFEYAESSSLCSDVSIQDYSRSLLIKNSNRKHFVSYLRKFRESLREVEITDSVLVSCLPTPELNVLKSEPAIKDKFFWVRLTRYLKMLFDYENENVDCVSNSEENKDTNADEERDANIHEDEDTNVDEDGGANIHEDEDTNVDEDGDANVHEDEDTNVDENGDANVNDDDADEDANAVQGACADTTQNTNEIVFQLAIERCLQVIGESVKASREHDPTMVSSIVTSAFPPSVSKCLIKIRNSLSHFDKKAVCKRMKMMHSSIYMEIKNELHELYKRLEYVNKIENFQTLKFFHHKVSEMLSLCEISSASVIEESANTRIKELTLKFHTDFPTFYEKLLVHLQNMHCLLKDTIKKMKSQDANQEKEITEEEESVMAKLSYYKELINVLLSRFIVESIYKNISVHPVRKCQELRNELKNISCVYDESSVSSKRKLAIRLRKSLYQIERKSKQIMNMSVKQSQNVLIPNIEKFKETLQGHYFLTNEECDQIRSEVPKHFKDDYNVGNAIFQRLNDNETKNIDSEFEKISEANRDFLRLPFRRSDSASFEKNLKTVTKTYACLEHCLEENSITRKDKEHICNKFKFTPSVKNILHNIEVNDDKQDHSLEFLKDRIGKMKAIIIGKVYENNMEQFESDSRDIKHYKIVQLFIFKESIQAAIEILFSDVTDLLEWKTNLKDVCIKLNGLFNGINIRHVLCHGNRSVEAISYLTDIYDLPNEIIKKVLDLVSDYDCIAAMSELYNKNVKLRCKQFVELVTSTDEDDFGELRQRITACDHWKEYAALIPGYIKSDPKSRKNQNFFLKMLLAIVVFYSLVYFLFNFLQKN